MGIQKYYINNIVIVVQSLSRVRLCNPLECSHGLPCPSLSPGVFPNSCPLCQQCYLIISSSVALSCHQSFPALGPFPVTWLFTSGGQSIGASASTSILPKKIQGCFPLGLTGLISLQSKELLRFFSSTTTQKHPFFSSQPSLWSISHIHI